MARQFKEGLDYFELDCVLDDNIRLLQAEFGLKGFAIIVKLWQKIYSGHGYYCEWSQDISLLFASDNGLSSGEMNLMENVIERALDRDVFSRDKFEQFSILTSRGIQKRYFHAVSRRENVSIKKEYLLIEVRNKTINVNNNSENVNSNSEYENRSTQSSGEKSREKKSREKEREDAPRSLFYGKFNNVEISSQEYEEIINTYEHGSRLVDQVSEYLTNASKTFRNHYALICKIAREDNWVRRMKIEVVEPEPEYIPTPEEAAEIEELKKQALGKLKGGILKEV